MGISTPGDASTTYTISSFQEIDTGTTLAAQDQTIDVSVGSNRAQMPGPSVSTFAGSRSSSYGRRISMSYTVPVNTLSTVPTLSLLFVWNI